MKIVKGKKGFQPKPKNEIKNKRVSVHLTETEYKNIIKFVQEHNTNVTNLIRLRLKDIL